MGSTAVPNDIIIGLTNGSWSWIGSRQFSVQQGFYVPPPGYGVAPVAANGIAQGVSADNIHPFDVSDRDTHSAGSVHRPCVL